MTQAAQTLEGTVERVIFQSPDSDYAVLRIIRERGPPVVMVGNLATVQPGMAFRATGRWREDKSWGRQFSAEAIEVQAPTSDAAMIAYLASGIVPGLGESLAERMVARFGGDLVRVIEEEPARLREVGGIGAVLQQRILEGWKSHAASRETMMVLQGTGIGPVRSKAIMERYGSDAPRILREDPYVIARDVRGIGFASADQLAARLGITGDAPRRVAAAIEHELRHGAEEGHTAMWCCDLLERAAALLETDRAVIETGLREAAARRLVEIRETAAEPIVQLAVFAHAERAIARELARLRKADGRQGTEPDQDAAATQARIDHAEARLGLALADEQRAAIELAMGERVAIVTGGPGTGKTTLVRAILAALELEEDAFALAAPTGRAARRLAESTQAEARTLHRLLEADPARGGFRRHAGRPLEAMLVIVDEVSMVDTLLMAALLDALPDGCRLILVGDQDQLPSVGAGQVLADLIATGSLPVIRLAHVFRQAQESGIVRGAHRIREGLAPVFARSDEEIQDFYGLKVKSAREAQQRIVELASVRIPERFGFDPWTEIQVLTPVNRGPLGTIELNRLLHAALNGEARARLERGDTVFATGDKIMATENDYDRELYNGDIGRITAIDEAARELVASFDGREHHFRGREIDSLQPAYAITVHKAQGSEYPAVILVLTGQHGRMLRRRLLYTAITRAKRLAMIVCEPDALERAVRDAGEQPRLTLLRQRFAETPP